MPNGLRSLPPCSFAGFLDTDLDGLEEEGIVEGVDAVVERTAASIDDPYVEAWPVIGDL